MVNRIKLMCVFLGIIISIGGIVGVMFSATADVTGMNVTQSDRDTMSFGWVQSTFVAVGIILLLFGIVFLTFIILKGKKTLDRLQSIFKEEPTPIPSGLADPPQPPPQDPIAQAPAQAETADATTQQPAPDGPYTYTAYNPQAQTQTALDPQGQTGYPPRAPVQEAVIKPQQTCDYQY